MSLADRFEAQRRAEVENDATAPGVSAVLTEPAQTRVPADAISDVKSRVMTELLARLGTRLNDRTLTEQQLHGMVRDELGKIVDAQNLLLTREERHQILQEVADDALGLGP